MAGIDTTSTSVDTLMAQQIDAHDQVYSDAPLKDTLKQVARSDYPIPVVERNGTFCGVISKDLMLQTLSHS